MRIIVDALGGDNAPGEAVKGAAMAAEEYGVTVVLVGPKAEIENFASKESISLTDIEVVDAPVNIPIEADPTTILKEYSSCSMAKGMQMLHDGEGDAFVSAGSTGALLVGGTFIVKRQKGVKRPALGAIVPCIGGSYILVDSGANVDCRPEMLVQFALMGSAYMNRVMGIENPKTGLLNIGTEPTKGTQLQIDAYKLLEACPVNFIGNIEGRGLGAGDAHVVVADGFSGNIALKTTEGVAKMISYELKELFKHSVMSMFAAVLVSGGIKRLKKSMDYTEVGGAPLLGLTKPVIKAHGSSNAKAFKNAIRQAKLCCERDIVGEIQKGLSALGTSGQGND